MLFSVLGESAKLVCDICNGLLYTEYGRLLDECLGKRNSRGQIQSVEIFHGQILRM